MAESRLLKWENHHRKTMGKPWEKPWEKPWKTEKWRFLTGKLIYEGRPRT
jgi:hypothetical protein